MFSCIHQCLFLSEGKTQETSFYTVEEEETISRDDKFSPESKETCWKIEGLWNFSLQPRFYVKTFQLFTFFSFFVVFVKNKYFQSDENFSAKHLQVLLIIVEQFEIHLQFYYFFLHFGGKFFGIFLS